MFSLHYTQLSVVFVVVLSSPLDDEARTAGFYSGAD